MARIHLDNDAELYPATVITEADPNSDEKRTLIPDELWARYQQAQAQLQAAEAEIAEYVTQARRAASWADAEEDDYL